MPLLWGKSLSKEDKQKTNKGKLINSIPLKLKQHFVGKKSSKSSVSQRYPLNTSSEKGSINLSLSALPSLQVSRSQSFNDESRAQPLPLPMLNSVVPSSLDVHGSSKPSLNSPRSRNGCDIKQKLHSDVWGDLGTGSVSSESSIETNGQLDSQFISPQASNYGSENVTAVNSPSRHRDHASILSRRILKDQLKPVSLPSSNHTPLTSTKKGPFGAQVTKLQIAPRAGYFSAPVSYISSPSQSPSCTCTHENKKNCSSFRKLYSDINLGTSGHCSCSGSPQNKFTPDHSPILSPTLVNPSQCVCRKGGGATPLHAWTERFCTEVSTDKPESHKLPLPPMKSTCVCPFPSSCSPVKTPNPTCDLGRPEMLISPVRCWKKGRLIGSGSFGHVYLGFNRDTGEMCAIKEVTLFANDAKSHESAQQLGQEITLLSSLQHPNIVRYFSSEMVDNKLFIYLEYVSGGSINKLLQEYGQLGESAIRSYTRQILWGLAYLHSKNTVHRDIKGANILVDPSGRVKLADFGMAKHVTDTCPLSFKGSPYWMAPEIIKKSCGNNLAVDIWSLGCTVIEMATTKPPWSQYEGVAALFKIGNSKELPAIPENLSEEGKDFVWRCLQRNPLHRPTALQLLDHPFVRLPALVERCFVNSDPLEPHFIATDSAINKGSSQGKTISSLNLEGVAAKLSRDFKHVSGLSNHPKLKHVSCPVSPIGSPLLYSKSSQPICKRMSPYISSSQIANSNFPYPINHFDHSGPHTPELKGTPRAQKSAYTCGAPFYGKTKMETLYRIPEISQGKEI